MRDPSVQVNLHENLYIDDQADINPSQPKPSAKISAKLHTRRMSEALASGAEKVRQIRKTDFLPTLGACRRIMQLDENEVPNTENPYRVEPTTERVLALGERTREMEKLETQKYKLVQQIAENKEYIDNLAKKRLNRRDDRAGIITDVKKLRMQGIPHLAPHIVTGAKDKSPSPTSTSLDISLSKAKNKLEPLTSRNRSVTRAN